MVAQLDASEEGINEGAVERGRKSRRRRVTRKPREGPRSGESLFVLVDVKELGQTLVEEIDGVVHEHVRDGEETLRMAG